MCRCMAWMGEWISRSRLFCDARTRSGARIQTGSRYSQGSYFSMTWMKLQMRSPVNREQLEVGSRKPWPNSVFSGLGEVVR